MRLCQEIREEVGGLRGWSSVTKRLLVSSIRDSHCPCRLLATPGSQKLALVVSWTRGFGEEGGRGHRQINHTGTGQKAAG